jgi:hypothetical protein
MGRSSEYQRNIIRMGFSWDLMGFPWDRWDFNGILMPLNGILLRFYWDLNGNFIEREWEYDFVSCFASENSWGYHGNRMRCKRMFKWIWWSTLLTCEFPQQPFSWKVIHIYSNHQLVATPLHLHRYIAETCVWRVFFNILTVTLWETNIAT